MAILIYNGIALPYTDTATYSQEVKYDPMGHTDRFTTDFDITVQCVINPDYIPVISNKLAALRLLPTIFGTLANPGQVMLALRNALLMPRGYLSFKQNGQELIPGRMQNKGNKPQPGAVDACNGPKPEYCNVSEFNDGSYIVDYRIKASYVEIISDKGITINGTKNERTSAVIACRWQEQATYNEFMECTLTRTGVYTIRSDHDAYDPPTAPQLSPLAEVGAFFGQLFGIPQQAQVTPQANPGPDWLRNIFAVVGVPSGFLRAHTDYKVTPDGLSLAYTLIDKEVFRIPPAPAYRAEGEYAEDAGIGMGVRHVECRIRLWGAKTTSQADLVRAALAILANKIVLGTSDYIVPTNLFAVLVLPDGSESPAFPVAIRNNSGVSIAVITRAYVRVGMWENWAEVMMRCLRAIAPTFINARTGESLGPEIVGASGPVSGTVTNNIIPFWPDQIAEDATVIRGYKPKYLPWGTSGFNSLLQAAAYYDPYLDTYLNQNTRQLNAGTGPGSSVVVPGQAGTVPEVA